MKIYIILLKVDTVGILVNVLLMNAVLGVSE